MEEKLKLTQLLFDDLVRNTKVHIAFMKEAKTKDCGYWDSKSYGDSNHGKTALKRKIIYLRQELLNLEKMLDGE